MGTLKSLLKFLFGLQVIIPSGRGAVPQEVVIFVVIIALAMLILCYKKTKNWVIVLALASAFVFVAIVIVAVKSGFYKPQMYIGPDDLLPLCAVIYIILISTRDFRKFFFSDKRKKIITDIRLLLYLFCALVLILLYLVYFYPCNVYIYYVFNSQLKVVYVGKFYAWF